MIDSASTQRRLEMKINLNVLEHLGMNLYSTIPAVLSEIVANAWDADAGDVEIFLRDEEISIQDDGSGMTRDDVIDRFLDVGFRRRKLEALTPVRKRHPMGRKGIGKLSSFSIADVVTVYTTRGSERTAFRMDANRMREQMQGEDSGSYYPEELDDWPCEFESGTRIVLTKLKHQVTRQTTRGLRQRIARRFSVIGPKYNFVVTVDDIEITPSDRGYHQHVEYVWTYGDQTDIFDLFRNLAENQPRSDRTTQIAEYAEKTNLTISGWIGTVKRPGSLKTEDNENLNRLAVFMRGKVAQENILDEFGQKEIYADYVVGEVHCDDLDRDDDDDIATSSRQSIKHDDPRFEAVRKIVLSELRHIASRWSDLRRSAGSRVFCRDVPEVAEWLNDLQGKTKQKAERWIGRLNLLRSGDEVKRELLKASILAFESYRRKEHLDFLENLSDQNIESVLQVFEDIDDLELSYYGQIVKLRLGVIKTLEEKLDANEKETVIRDHIYKHLWLLDPSWERVKGSEASERKITTFLRGTSEELTEEEKNARIDIGYRTAPGRHVIIELKRASVRTPVTELTRQVLKYRNGAKKLIDRSSFPHWPLEIICLVGKGPPEWEDEKDTVEKMLASVNARLVFYDELLERSLRSYADYLEEHKKIDRLWKIFQGIDDFASAATTE